MRLNDLHESSPYARRTLSEKFDERGYHFDSSDEEDEAWIKQGPPERGSNPQYHIIGILSSLPPGIYKSVVTGSLVVLTDHEHEYSSTLHIEDDLELAKQQAEDRIRNYPSVIRDVWKDRRGSSGRSGIISANYVVRVFIEKHVPGKDEIELVATYQAPPALEPVVDKNSSFAYAWNLDALRHYVKLCNDMHRESVASHSVGYWSPSLEARIRNNGIVIGLKPRKIAIRGGFCVRVESSKMPCQGDGSASSFSDVDYRNRYLVTGLCEPCQKELDGAPN